MPGKVFGPRQRRMRVKKLLVIQLEHGQINPRRDGLHRGGDFVAGLVRLDLHLAGVIDHMRVGQNAFAFDHHAAAA